MSAPKQQTAVEWLVDKLPHSMESWYSKQIEQAKAMEKEQITKAYNANLDFETIQTAEQYYKETYNNNDRNNG